MLRHRPSKILTINTPEWSQIWSAPYKFSNTHACLICRGADQLRLEKLLVLGDIIGVWCHIWEHSGIHSELCHIRTFLPSEYLHSDISDKKKS